MREFERDQFDEDDFDEEFVDDAEDLDREHVDDEDDSAETVPCRECGAAVYHDAVQCCYCGIYGPTDDPDGAERRFPRRPIWFWILGFLGIVTLILTLLMH